MKSVAETCYVEEYLPEDACSAFKNTLNKRCPFIREQVVFTKQIHATILHEYYCL